MTSLSQFGVPRFASVAPSFLSLLALGSAVRWEVLKWQAADVIEVDLVYWLMLTVGGLLLYRVSGVIGGFRLPREKWVAALLYSLGAAWLAFGTRPAEWSEWTQLLALGGAWVGAALVSRLLAPAAPTGPESRCDVKHVVRTLDLAAVPDEDRSAVIEAVVEDVGGKLRESFARYRPEAKDSEDAGVFFLCYRSRHQAMWVCVAPESSAERVTIAVAYNVPTYRKEMRDWFLFAALASIVLCVVAGVVWHFLGGVNWRLLLLTGGICWGALFVIGCVISLPFVPEGKRAFRDSGGDRSELKAMLSRVELPSPAEPSTTPKRARVSREAQRRATVMADSSWPLTHLAEVEECLRERYADPTKADLPTAHRGKRIMAPFDQENHEACSKLQTLGEAALQQYRLANPNALRHIRRQIVDVGRKLKALDGIRLVDRVYHRLEDTAPPAVLREITLTWKAELEDWSM